MTSRPRDADKQSQAMRIGQADDTTPEQRDAARRKLAGSAARAGADSSALATVLDALDLLPDNDGWT